MKTNEQKIAEALCFLCVGIGIGATIFGFLAGVSLIMLAMKA